MEQVNEPFVAIRQNGRVTNFPYGGVVNYFPNRSKRHKAMKEKTAFKREGAKTQIIYCIDKKTKKPIRKRIYHYVQS